MPLFWERLFDDFTTTRQWAAGTLLSILLVALGVLFLVVGGLFNAVTGQPTLLALIGFVLLVNGAIAIAMIADARRSEGENLRSNGPCPKCGASPGGMVTANGFTRCGRCGEPYFAF